MKRGGPLKRRTRLKAKRSTKRRSGRVRDTEYMLRVKGLDCCAGQGRAVVWSCLLSTELPMLHHIEAHHAGKRAAGRKADDDTCIPLCRHHHRQWHSASGVFEDWTRDQRRAWADARIAETQAKLRHPHTQVEPLKCPF